MSERVEGAPADAAVAEAVAQAVREAGHRVSGEPRRVQGMVNDVLGEQSRTRRAEVDAVVLAAEESVPEDLLRGRVSAAEAVGRLRGRGLDDGVALFAIDVWRYALGMLGSGSQPPTLQSSLETISQSESIEAMRPVVVGAPRSRATLPAVDVTVVPETHGERREVTSRTGSRWLIGTVSVLVVALIAVLVFVVVGGDDDPGSVSSGDGATGGARDQDDADAESSSGADPSKDNGESMPGAASTAVPASTPLCVGQSDGLLKLAGLVTQTGDGAYFGAPRAAAIQLAVQDVNEAGGVLGAPLEVMLGDTAGSTDLALANVSEAVTAGADGFVLGFDEYDSYEVVEETVVSACTVSVAPIAWESTGLCESPLSFCTAPTPALMSRALAEVVIAEGIDSVALLRTEYENDADFVDAFFDQGGVEVASEVYDPADIGTLPADFVLASGAGAVVVIGFDGVPEVLRSLFGAGLTPATGVPVYVLNRPFDDELAGVVPVGSMNGVRSIQPPEPSADFAQRLRSINPDSYMTYLAQEAYDSVVVMALAAVLAGTDESSAVAAQVLEVTRDGEKCTSFGDCAALIAAGADIDYDGFSGPMEFGPDGIGVDAVFDVLTYGADDTVDSSRTEAWYVAR